jgi:hypothetical protein
VLNLYEAAQQNNFSKAGFYESRHIVTILHTLRNGRLKSYRVYTSNRIENCASYRSVSRCRRAHARGAVISTRTRSLHTVIRNDWRREWLQCTRPAEGWSIPPAPQQRYWESLLSSEVGTTSILIDDSNITKSISGGNITSLYIYIKKVFFVRVFGYSTWHQQSQVCSKKNNRNDNYG